MARFDNPTGEKKKYKQTKAIHGMHDKQEVESGLKDGAFLLMERTTHAKENGTLVPYVDRRFMPAELREKREKQGWIVVDMSGDEKADTIPTVTKKSAKAV